MRNLLSFAILIILLAAAGVSPQVLQVQGLSDNSIKIGLFAPFSGPVSNYGKISEGIESIYRRVNDAGGIHGRRFEFVVEDDACSPPQGIAAVRKLIYQDKVFMIHGGNCSNVVIAALPEIVKAGIPYMVQGAASSAITEVFHKNVFTPVFTSTFVGRTMANFAASVPNASRIAIVRQTDEWGRTMYEPTVARLNELGVSPVAEAVLEPTATRATAQVLSLRAAKPDVVIAAIYPQNLAIFLREAWQLRLSVPIVTTTAVSIEDEIKRVGIPEATEELYVVYPFRFTIDDPRAKPIIDLIHRYFPRHEIESISFLGIGGAEAVVEALRRAGRQLTWERFIGALESLRNFKTSVYAAPISFSERDRIGLEELGIVTVEKGKVVMIGSNPDQWKRFFQGRK